MLIDLMAWPQNSKHCDHRASVQSTFPYFTSLVTICLSKESSLVIYYLSVKSMSAGTYIHFKCVAHKLDGRCRVFMYWAVLTCTVSALVAGVGRGPVVKRGWSIGLYCLRNFAPNASNSSEILQTQRRATSKTALKNIGKPVELK